MKEIILKHTKILPLLLANKDKRTISLQGSSRSSKTFSILQYMLIESLLEEHKDKGLIFSICRKSGTSLKLSTQRDFFKILKEMGLYTVDSHTKSSPEKYEINGNYFYLLSLDDPTKKQGTDHYMCYVDEAIEIDYDMWSQLAIRTTHQMLASYNPSRSNHWLYTKVNTKPDTFFHKSTYKMNPFITQKVIDEIENLKNTDLRLYQIYALGERAELKGQVISNYKFSDNFKGDICVYGIDFGFSAPSAIVKVSKHDNEFYIQELLYKTGLTNQDLIEFIKRSEIKPTDILYCDSAEPDRLLEIQRAGYRAIKSNKNIEQGLDFIRRNTLNLYKCPNLELELEGYQYKDGTDIIIPSEDHCIDSMRYAIYTHWGNKTSFKASDFIIDNKNINDFSLFSNI